MLLAPGKGAHAFGPGLVLSGMCLSAFSSALGAVIGGSRVLHSLARDELLPFLRWFGRSGSGNARRGVAASWAIAQLSLVAGGQSLGAIAPVISVAFLLSYALLNLACFVLAASGTPNFRPGWRWWSKWSALAGFVLCVVALFAFDVVAASVAIGLLLLLTTYLTYRGPKRGLWGDVSQALIFHQVRKYLLRLDERRASHPRSATRYFFLRL